MKLNHKTLTVTYYHSNLIEEMLFQNEEDAEHFDIVLENFMNNKEAINEFESVKLASIEAVRYHINNNSFIELLGETVYLDELIEASERMIDGYNGATADDCYKLPLIYIFNKLYGKYL